MRTPARILLATAVATVGLALPGCGGSGGDTSCDDEVCTVESDGPGTYTIDQQATEVEVSDLTADSVHVRLNSAEATLRRGGDPVRMRGFLVSAPETGTDHVKVRIER